MSTQTRYICPNCKQSDQICVEMRKWGVISHDQAGEADGVEIDDSIPMGNGDCEYDSRSLAMCNACDHGGILEDFENKEYMEEI